ncbi:MAG TPA: ArsR family transcriptional regulator [Symbiobacteriaceae bacterium]|nr:ArsR family transcriptional regulator [Symbiobacteriaceae bacterium]
MARKNTPNPTETDVLQAGAQFRRDYRERRRRAKEMKEQYFPLPKAFLSLLNHPTVDPPAIALLLYLMLTATAAGEVRESAASIARNMGVTQSAISRRFETLEAAGLVKRLQLKPGASYHAFLRPFPPDGYDRRA